MLLCSTSRDHVFHNHASHNHALSPFLLHPPLSPHPCSLCSFPLCVIVKILPCFCRINIISSSLFLLPLFTCLFFVSCSCYSLVHTLLLCYYFNSAYSWIIKITSLILHLHLNWPIPIYPSFRKHKEKQMTIPCLITTVRFVCTVIVWSAPITFSK